VPKEIFAGKVVLIGSVTLDLEDHFIGMRGNKVSGVYVHASILTSLLNQEADTPLAPPWTIILLTLFAGLSGYAIIRAKSVYGQIGLILGLLILVVLLATIVYSQGTIIPLPWLAADVLLSAGYVTLVRFVVERKQNQQVQSLFSKYVHKDVLAELMSSNTEIRLGGERKPVTVLFSDLRGFTSLSESLSPEELTSTLNGYLSAMTPHILEEKGTIDKFIGDAIMAFWNAPLPVEHHPLHAVRSALRMHDALKTFNTREGTTLAVGIGIHTGQAIVGNVGGKDRVNYTILGDTVNLASRIEGLTKKYGVGTIVTKAVRDTISDDSLAFRCLDVITVLGKVTPTTLYEVRYSHDFPEGMIEDYERAFKYYYEKEWNKAEAIWKKLAKKGDVPSEKLLARIPELRKKGDWDGIWRFDEK
jgi:adenylate cyclase